MYLLHLELFFIHTAEIWSITVMEEGWDDNQKSPLHNACCSTSSFLSMQQYTSSKNTNMFTHSDSSSHLPVYNIIILILYYS